jgi:hypothetical protein
LVLSYVDAILVSKTIADLILSYGYTNIWWCSRTSTITFTSGAGAAYPSRVNEISSGFFWDSCYSIFSYLRYGVSTIFCILVFFLSLILRILILR